MKVEEADCADGHNGDEGSDDGRYCRPNDDDDVVDITSSSALDVVKINNVNKINTADPTSMMTSEYVRQSPMAT